MSVKVCRTCGSPDCRKESHHAPGQWVEPGERGKINAPRRAPMNCAPMAIVQRLRRLALKCAPTPERAELVRTIDEYRGELRERMRDIEKRRTRT